jgi:hypothetical protein
MQVPESAITSIMMISRNIMVESELGGRFWFKSAMTGCEARNVTHKERIGTTPWRLMRGEKKCIPISSIRLQGNRTKKEGKTGNKSHEQWGQSTLDSNNLKTSAYSFFIPEKNTIMSSNQAQFDETVFPFRKKKIIG